MVEVVEVAAVWVASVNGINFVIGAVKTLRETAEELGHGEVSFKVGHVGGGVQDPRFAVRTADGVAGPEIAVDKGGEGGLCEKYVKTLGDAGEVAPCALVQKSPG